MLRTSSQLLFGMAVTEAARKMPMVVVLKVEKSMMNAGRELGKELSYSGEALESLNWRDDCVIDGMFVL